MRKTEEGYTAAETPRIEVEPQVGHIFFEEEKREQGFRPWSVEQEKKWSEKPVSEEEEKIIAELREKELEETRLLTKGLRGPNRTLDQADDRDKQLRAEMAADGGTPDKGGPYGSVEEFDATHEDYFVNKTRRIKEIHEEQIGQLKEQYDSIKAQEDNETDEEKILALIGEELFTVAELRSRYVCELYRQLDTVNSIEQKEVAETIKGQILQNFEDEQQALRDVSEWYNNPIVEAYSKTRGLELEKMKIECNIRWNEKLMWDLKVDWSEDKQALANEAEGWKRDQLYPLFQQTLSAIRAEEGALQGIQESTDWSARKSEIIGRRIEFETYVKHHPVGADGTRPLENEIAQKSNVVEFPTSKIDQQPNSEGVRQAA